MIIKVRTQKRHHLWRFPILLNIFKSLDDAHSFHNFAKNHMFTIQMRRGDSRDEKLAAIGTRTCIGHW